MPGFLTNFYICSVELCSFNLNSAVLKYAENRHKAFYYHYYTSDHALFRRAVERWKGKNELLERILEQIQNNDNNWFQREELMNQRDLSGTRFRDIDLSQSLSALDYTNLEYCWFDGCNFSSSSEQNNSHDSIFGECNLNNSLFKNCRFSNVSFSGGDFQNIVFYNCVFEGVNFNKNRDGRYGGIFFQNCEFRKCDFNKVSLDSCCFWGECFFQDLTFTEKTFSPKHLIGKNILKLCKQWDLESFAKRKEIGYVGEHLNKIEIIEEKQHSEDPIIHKLSSLMNAYEGLISLYKYLYAHMDRQGEHLAYLHYNYIYSWLCDEYTTIEKGWHRNLKIILSRHVLGYGVKVKNSIVTFFIMVVLFAFAFMQTGVLHMGVTPVQRMIFDFSDMKAWAHDFILCFYYSIITAATVGYGDVVPVNHAGMLLANLEAILGIIIMTLVTVIFARRFFK